MKRKLPIGLGISVLLVLLVAGGWFLARPPQLLAHARLVGSTTGWHEGERIYYSIDSHWLSDQELLHVRLEGQKRDVPMFYRWDLRTNQETKLSDLTASRRDLTASRRDLQDVVDDQRISPDGRWLLCSSFADDCLLAQIDGTTHRLYSRRYAASNRTLHWLPDSRHWVEMYISGRVQRLFLHDAQNLDLCQELPGAPEILPQLFLTPDQVVCIKWPDEDYNALGQLNTDSSTRGHTKRVVISLRSLQNPNPPIAEHTLVLPIEVEHNNFVLSPDGKRVAWFVTSKSSSPLLDLLHRFVPSVNSTAAWATSLWISDLDGHNRYEIGRIEAASDPDRESHTDSGFFVPDTLIERLNWLPSGKSLSFEYQNALYTVPGSRQVRN